ncbi:MAG: carbohydrate ABC transporter permease [Bacilli bacterium]|nr:carbohydrate ABC transporter permease [Bacilli bacterium]MDD4076647.1 carbohydrate ABC transporter permease [Bacilli bacterium]MDD4389025.1 carbohydrate ABC transporter permease [Bacilli bacterium]
MKRLKLKKILFGKELSDGLVFKIIIYVLLIAIGFVYLYPILYMVSSSFKSAADIVNPMVNWIPTNFYLENYRRSLKVLNYGPTLTLSLLVTLLPALLQTAVTSLIGYGFAKYQFRGKKLWMMLVLSTFIVPVQVYMIPRYVMFNQFKLLESSLAVILPALCGQGVNSAIFILVFYQFFRMIPQAYNEAAELDGAGPYQIFFRIAVPLAVPAYITCFLFGFVWYWNETYLLSLFLPNYPNLQLQLANFVSAYSSLYGEHLMKINEGIRLAATLLIILPMLIVYLIMQKWFVEGVEKTGITGE